MSIQENDWRYERGRLERVMLEIKKELGRLEGILEHRGAEVLDIRQNFWDEVSVNLSNYDDVAETAASITQQQAILSQQERSFRHAEQTFHKLQRLKKSPYFARIDFRENGASRAEEIYIGISSVADEETHDLLIYDWRAPVSGMFYDYTPGPARYQTLDGEIQGEMELKRQYIIKHGKLEDMFDTGINIGDEMLQVMLAKSAHEKMSSIVMTIQQEQNRIIRDDEHPILVVQGAAGSGKTSVALQRVAYLLYKYRNSLSADQMLLFSPNSIFNDYVSNVLPELGEANMLQTTFQDHLDRGFDDEWKVEDIYDQFEYLLTETQRAEYPIRLKGIEWKTSSEFMTLLDRYLEHVKKADILFEDFAFRDKVLISKEQLAELFYIEFGHDPSISNRLDKVKEKVLAELDIIQQRVARNVFKRMKQSPKYLGSDKEMKDEAGKKAKRAIGPLRDRAKSLGFVDMMGMYTRLFSDPKWVLELGGKPIEEFEKLGAYTQARISAREIPYEDATPIVYMQSAFKGFNRLNRIKQVVIDEAQDYSPFQLVYIRRLFPRARFTLLGDLNQGIYYANVQSYSRLGELFGEDNVGIVKMKKSYRSTSEIIEFTRQILRNPEPVETIGRTGEFPKVTEVRQADQLAASIQQAVHSLTQQGAESIAIICKTSQEAEQAYQSMLPLLNNNVHLFTKKTRTFVSGIVVVPAYLAKGLEFDGVIIYNASQEVYAHESDRKLLYTACTRALHYLQVFYTGELTSMLKDVPIAAN